MANSVVGICNSALIKIGCSDLIVSLADQNKRAILCNEQFPKIRDEVLRAHPWSFAKKRAQLGQVAGYSSFGYAYAFQIPLDCLKIIGSDYSDVEFKKEGNKILCDNSSFNLRYIAQITDPTLFDADFCEALACRLACDLAYSIAQSVQLSQAMGEAYKGLLAQARSMNAQEGTPDNFEAETWIIARC